MIPSDLNLHQSNFSPANQISRPGGTETPQAAVDKSVNTIDTKPGNPDGWVEIDRSRFPLSKRQASTSNLNAVARSIRLADKTMKEIGKHVDDMKSRLKTHVKNYPPFPPGSEERVKVLKSFSAFRKLIDELTMPPDDDTAAMILNVTPGETGDAGIVLEHEGFGKTVRSQPVGTDPGGLDIPEFPARAADTDFEFMIEKLDRAGRTLENRRTGLQADAAGIFNSPGA
jgi:hypothetical protein